MVIKMSRYTNRNKVVVDKNEVPYYRKQIENRNLNSVVFYRPDNNLSLDYSFILEQEYLTFVWSINSRMHKYAYDVMGSSTLWWIIALVNKKPTDSHWKVGDVVYVPTKPEVFLRYLEV